MQVLPPDRLLECERSSLRAIIDGLISPDPLSVTTLATPAAIDALGQVILGPNVHAAERLNLRVLLCALSSSVGTALLTLSPGKPFASRSARECERLLLRLGTSPLGLHRFTFLSLKSLVLSVCATYTDAAGVNPLSHAAGYPGNGPALAAGLPAILPSAYELRPPDDAERLDCDVVIVGSGCGGGVCAAVLAQAGLDVIVVEKGVYVPPGAISGLEKPAYETMYEKGGLLTSSDGAISILAGSTLGGGSTVNWACCLPPPRFVREEWATQLGLPQFAPGAAAFDASIAAVLRRIGAGGACTFSSQCYQIRKYKHCPRLPSRIRALPRLPSIRCSPFTRGHGTRVVRG